MVLAINFAKGYKGDAVLVVHLRRESVLRIQHQQQDIQFNL